LPEAERKLEPTEALAVRFAEKVATDHLSVDTAFMAELREQFSEAQVVELSMMIGQYISFGRQLVMLGIGKGACEIYTTGD
jgi:alkylhydroperoxidase family enzyme